MEAALFINQLLCWKSCRAAWVFLIENTKDIMSCCSIILCVQLVILADVHLATDSTYVFRHDIGIHLRISSYMHRQGLHTLINVQLPELRLALGPLTSVISERACQRHAAADTTLLQLRLM